MSDEVVPLLRRLSLGCEDHSDQPWLSESAFIDLMSFFAARNVRLTPVDKISKGSLSNDHIA
jgi:hypothetical protein